MAAAAAARTSPGIASVHTTREPAAAAPAAAAAAGDDEGAGAGAGAAAGAAAATATSAAQLSADEAMARALEDADKRKAEEEERKADEKGRKAVKRAAEKKAAGGCGEQYIKAGCSLTLPAAPRGGGFGRTCLSRIFFLPASRNIVIRIIFQEAQRRPLCLSF